MSEGRIAVYLRLLSNWRQITSYLWPPSACHSDALYAHLPQMHCVRAIESGQRLIWGPCSPPVLDDPQDSVHNPQHERSASKQSTQSVDNTGIWKCCPSFHLSTHGNLSAIESSTAGERLKAVRGLRWKLIPGLLTHFSIIRIILGGVSRGAAVMTPPGKYPKYLF